MALSPSVANALRAALTSQGISADVISADGTINAAGLLAAAYDTIELRTNLLPPVVIRTSDLGKKGGQGFNVGRLVRPALIMEGRAGRAQVAPYGIPGPIESTLYPLAFLGGLIGLGFWLGRTWK